MTEKEAHQRLWKTEVWRIERNNIVIARKWCRKSKATIEADIKERDNAEKEDIESILPQMDIVPFFEMNGSTDQ